MKSMKNIDISQNRYTYYCHSVYIPPMHRNKMRRILQGIASYRLDTMYEHPLNGLHVPLVQSLMSVDEYFRKNITKMKYSQFNNPNSVINKKRLMEMILTRIFDKEEEVDTAPLVAQVSLSLINQIYLLRILDPKIKAKMYTDVSDILMAEFKINPTELDSQELGKKDSENHTRVAQEFKKRKRNSESLKNEITTMHSLDECRILLEQIECGVRNHLLVTTNNIPTEEIVKTTCEIGGYTFIPVFSNKLVARYFDGSRFKEALQTKKAINKKVVLYISDSHYADIVYADLLNLLISYQDERIIFREKEYIDRL